MKRKASLPFVVADIILLISQKINRKHKFYKESRAITIRSKRESKTVMVKKKVRSKKQDVKRS
jgi:hypothetical protein